jgi:hypothetical protein
MKRLTQSKSVYLIKKRIFTKDMFYKVISKNNFLFFCRIKSSSAIYLNYESAAVNTKLSEAALLKDRHSFKLRVAEISAISINTEHSTWNIINNGTVEITVSDKTIEYLIYCETPVEFLKDFLGKAGSSNISLTEPATAPIQSYDKKIYNKNRKLLSQIVRYLNILFAGTTVWMFIYPVYFYIGITLLLLYTLFALFLFIKYHSFFQIKNRKGNRISMSLQGPLIIPPLVAVLLILINIKIPYKPMLFIIILLLSSVITFFCLFYKKKLRNKNYVFIIMLISSAFLFSGAVTTNYVAGVSTVSRYTATIESKNIQTRSRTPITYYLRLSPWGNNKQENDFLVSSPVYSRTSVGQTITIELIRGLWGIEWYEPIFNNS